MPRSSNFRSQRSNRDDQLDEILTPEEFNGNRGRENRLRDDDNDQFNSTTDLTSQSDSGRDWCLKEDDGQGIPKNKREAVFKAFYRIDEARLSKSANTGLGLTIAKDIVQSHGGRIILSSSPLGGLKVELSFMSLNGKIDKF